MTWTGFVALATFAGIASWTPGPNNTILMASGLNHGFRRTLPTILGVVLGFPVMIAIVGLGLGEVFKAYPLLYQILKYAGAAYMLWMAFKIASSRPSDADDRKAEPFSFLQIALFQWINPKAWIMAVTAISAYTLPEHYLFGLAVVVTTFMFCGITSSSGWTLFGASLRHIMNDPRYFRIINGALAIALVASLVPMLWN